MKKNENSSKVKIVDLKTKKQSEVTCEAWKHLQTITYEKGKKRYAAIVDVKVSAEPFEKGKTEPLNPAKSDGSILGNENENTGDGDGGSPKGGE